jgi:hypothetical protein
MRPPGRKALVALNFFMADTEAGIGPFRGVLLAGRGWATGAIGAVTALGAIAGMLATTPAIVHDAASGERLIAMHHMRQFYFTAADVIPAGLGQAEYKGHRRGTVTGGIQHHIVAGCRQAARQLTNNQFSAAIRRWRHCCPRRSQQTDPEGSWIHETNAARQRRKWHRHSRMESGSAAGPADTKPTCVAYIADSARHAAAQNYVSGSLRSRRPQPSA